MFILGGAQSVANVISVFSAETLSSDKMSIDISYTL